MNYKPANQKNLVRCEGCSAVYDKTIKWSRGYYYDTRDVLEDTNTVPEKSCPV